MVSFILVGFLLLLAACVIRNPVYGIMCYYIIRMLIPSATRVFSFSFNTISLGLLLLFILPHIIRDYKQNSISAKKYVKSTNFIVIGLFILTFVGTIPFSFQWAALFQMYMTEIVPSILLVLYLTKGTEYKKFCNIVCIMALFTALYGIYTYISADNPIFLMFNNSGEAATDLEEYATGRLGMSGIAVGIYGDKIALSLISFLLLIFLINKNCVNKSLLSLTCILTFIDMFLTTQRTALFCLFLFVFLMMFDKEDKVVKKYIKTSIILLVLLAFFVDSTIFLDSFYSLIYIFDDKKQLDMGIGGSSTGMRFMQFTNVFDYLGIERILQGGGYGYAEYYYTYIFKRALFGMDPRFLGFESFMLKTLMGSGIIGCLIWLIGLFKMFKALFPNKQLYDTAFFCSYILAILMTDTSASFYLFFFLLVLNSKRYLLSDVKIIREFGIRNTRMNN